MTELDYQQQVLVTLGAGERDEWSVSDNVATSERYNARFWFEDGTPCLLFDGFLPGHIELEQNELEDPKAILREIDIEVARWMEHDMDFEHAREFDRNNPEYWNYIEVESPSRTCADPDHGIGDHPCDEVLGAEAAAAQRDAAPAVILRVPDALVDITTFAINHFGTGEHPVAEQHNLQYFKLPYVRECLQRMIDSDNVTDLGRSTAQTALAALETSNDN